MLNYRKSTLKKMDFKTDAILRDNIFKSSKPSIKYQNSDYQDQSIGLNDRESNNFHTTMRKVEMENSLTRSFAGSPGISKGGMLMMNSISSFLSKRID